MVKLSRSFLCETIPPYFVIEIWLDAGKDHSRTTFGQPPSESARPVFRAIGVTPGANRQHNQGSKSENRWSVVGEQKTIKKQQGPLKTPLSHQDRYCDAALPV
jgi:hypothetical protein